MLTMPSRKLFKYGVMWPPWNSERFMETKLTSWYNLHFEVENLALHHLSHLAWPRWHSSKEYSCQCRGCKKCEYNPWVRMIPWSREWKPSPVFLPGKFHRRRSLAGYSPWGCKESDMTEHTLSHTHNMCVDRLIFFFFFFLNKNIEMPILLMAHGES